MKKDVKRKRVAAKRTVNARQQAWRYTAIVFLIMAAVAVFGLYLYKNKSGQLDTTAVTASIDRLKNWVAERRGRLQQKIVKVKQMAVNNTEQPIHFDFYSELPKMQVPVPAAETKEQG